MGISICGWGLKLFGYVEGAPQTEFVPACIRPCFPYCRRLLLISVVLLMRYPITVKHTRKSSRS
jgi:Na+/melibiose symporter-like transporter